MDMAPKPRWGLQPISLASHRSYVSAIQESVGSSRQNAPLAVQKLDVSLRTLDFGGFECGDYIGAGME